MRSLLILTVGLAFTVMVTPALAQATPADEAAIVKAAEQFPAAWAKGKSAGGALHDGCGYVSSTGLMARGRAEIEKAYMTQLSGVYKGTSLKNANTNIRFLKPDVAISNGTFEIAGVRGPDGKVAPPRSGTVTSVVVKQNGQWLITALRAIVPPPAK